MKVMVTYRIQHIKHGNFCGSAWIYQDPKFYNKTMKIEKISEKTIEKLISEIKEENISENAGRDLVIHSFNLLSIIPLEED